MSFTTTLKVRFGDVDKAGIVYYPVILHYAHVAFEEYFEQRVGIPYPDLIETRRRGFPTVRAEATFERPFRYGRPVRVRVGVLGIGGSSVRFEYVFEDETAGERLARAEITTVCVDMDDFRPREVPDDLRAVFAATTT